MRWNRFPVYCGRNKKYLVIFDIFNILILRSVFFNSKINFKLCMLGSKSSSLLWDQMDLIVSVMQNSTTVNFGYSQLVHLLSFATFNKFL